MPCVITESSTPRFFLRHSVSPALCLEWDNGGS